MPKYCEVGTGVSFDAGMSGAVTTRVAIARMAAERGVSCVVLIFLVEGGGRERRRDLRDVVHFVQILQIYRQNFVNSMPRVQNLRPPHITA
jgi:hypothetical protein